MKSVLISINPKWCELIASGEKTVEVRKTMPQLETPFKVYIYETKGRTETPFVDEDGHHIFKGRGQVIGEFVCERIDMIGWFKTPDHPLWEDYYDRDSCLTDREIYEYSEGGTFYRWHISGLVIYYKPRELYEFKTFCKSYFEGDRCEDCKYFIDGRWYEYDESDCGCDGLKPLERPPQSWCYVEGRANDENT